MTAAKLAVLNDAKALQFCALLKLKAILASTNKACP
jgi:hypothetical protein